MMQTRRMKATWLAILLFAACHDSAGNQPGGDNDPCATAGEGTREVWAKEAAKRTSEADRQSALEMGKKQADRIVRHCRSEHWSPEAIACVREGTKSCTGVLTPEQVKGLMGAFRD